MDLVRNDVVEQALVVGDDEHADICPSESIHSCGDDLECIDIETAICLVKHRIGGLEHRHLENLTTLLLTAGEAFVHRAGGEITRHAQRVHVGVEFRVVVGCFEFLSLRKTGLKRGTDEVGDGDAGDLHRILEG